MPERERDRDPIASTQVFRAFVQRGDVEPAGGRRSRVVGLAVTLAVLALVVVVFVVWLIAR